MSPKATTTRLKRLAKRPASFLLLATFLLSLIACSSERVPVRINFDVEWAGNSLACDSSGLALTDLRFYVSDVILVDSTGGEQQLLMTADGKWQQTGITLIDLETGDAACQNGTSPVNTAIVGTADGADIVGLRFTVGVPFALNHENPLLAEAPLDDSAMHWHWRSGYKFVRAGVATDNDGFWMHLGSTGCEGTVQNISGCESPNRVNVVLTDFVPDQDRVVVDLSALFSEISFDDGVRSDCSSSPAELTCSRPFEALGLAFDANASLGQQRVFRAHR